jgi:hypothetical protein
MYPMLGGVANSIMFNAKDPRNLDVAYRLTYIGSGLVFNYNGILTPNASQAAANTNLTPSLTYSGNAQTSIMYFSGDSSSLSSNVFLNGSYRSAPGNDYFQSLEITGGELTSVYYDRSNAISFGANLTGLVIQSTDGSNVFAMRNGVQIGTSSLVGDVSAYPIYLGALNLLNQSPPYFPCSNLQISFYANTTFLTSAEAQTLSTIINTFQTTLGRNTY